MSRSKAFYAVVFLAAFILGSLVLTGGYIYHLWTVGILMGLALVFLVIKKPSLGLILLLISAGLLFSSVSFQWFLGGLKCAPGSIIRGTISTEPVVTGKTQTFLFTPLENKAVRFEIRTNQFPKYEYGERLELSGKFSHAQKKDLARRVIGKYSFPKIIKISHNKTILGKLRWKLIGLKNLLISNIAKSTNEPASGLLAGVLFGTKSALSPEMLQLLIASGTVHIIALSGYNITILIRFFERLIGGSKRVRFLFSTTAILFFILATGLSASIVRAAIMGWAWLLAKTAGRQDEPITAIFFAAAIMIALNPFVALYDIGFQLSFAAFIGIIYLGPLFEDWFRFFNSASREALAGSLAASLLTWPIMAYHFGQVSIIAPIVNVFVLPFVPLLMGLGLLVGIVTAFSAYAGSMVGYIGYFLSIYVFKVAEIFGRSGFSVSQLKISSTLLIVGYYIILIEMVFILRKERWRSRVSLKNI